MGEATGCQLSFPGALPQTQRSTQTIRHTAPGSALEVLWETEELFSCCYHSYQAPQIDTGKPQSINQSIMGFIFIIDFGGLGLPLCAILCLANIISFHPISDVSKPGVPWSSSSSLASSHKVTTKCKPLTSIKKKSVAMKCDICIASHFGHNIQVSKLL